MLHAQYLDAHYLDTHDLLLYPSPLPIHLPLSLGFLTALGVTCYGLALTASASPDAIASFPSLPYGFFSSSFLLDQLGNDTTHLYTLPTNHTVLNTHI